VNPLLLDKSISPNHQYSLVKSPKNDAEITISALFKSHLKKINSGAIPNSLKVSALFLYFFTALGKACKHAMVLHNGKGTRARNLNRYLHRNPPETDQVSAPEPSRTATSICIGTLQILTRYLNQHELIQTQSCWMTRRY